jgi:ABC-2 type transport system ATP-binding protein
MNDYALEVSGLTKRFGARTALDGVDLKVPRGIAFGYLGPKGAGKTTLLRVVLGLTRPDGGTIRVLGHPIPQQRAMALARVGALVGEPGFHEHLTGRENLRVLASLREKAASNGIAPVLERVGLAGRADRKVSTYSTAMRQRLALGACLLGDPELLLLDEPMHGLDPDGILEVRELIRECVEEGRTVVLFSHLLDEVERTCEAVAIVDQGQVLVEGLIAEVKGSATASISIRCLDRKRAVSVVQRHPEVGRIEHTPEGILLFLVLGADHYRTAAEVNRMLFEHGVWVYGLDPQWPSLWDRYVELTAGAGTGR